MKEIKLNTIPFGKFVIIIFLFVCFITTSVAGAIIFREGFLNSLSISLLILTIILILISISLFLSKGWNNVYVSDIGVRHKKKSYNWSELYISVSQSKPLGTRDYSIRTYFYFNNKYLVSGEEKSKSIKKEGFYLVINKSRAYEILSRYNKEIKILCEFSEYSQKLSSIIEEHNNKCQQT